MLSKTAPLSDWLAWLETLSPVEIDLGLERVREVKERLDLALPEHLLLIAGTNGKGSSVLMCDAILRASGVTVGAYTSPHISRYNERIVVNGEPADDTCITAAFAKVDAARGDVRLTYFEFGTLAAAVIFADAGVDAWILEIGLGGRLDACNVFAPTASLITNISLDHCDWLGDTVEAIAREKAGVMRAGRPTVFGAEPVPAAIRDYARSCGADLLCAGSDFSFAVEEGQRWSWRCEHAHYHGLKLPGLSGEFQIANAAAVLMLLQAAGLADAIESSLLNRVLPGLQLVGRMQRRYALGRHWLFDVAHNPAAAGVLAANLAETAGAGATIGIVGLLSDKDMQGVLKPLLQQVDRWIAVSAASHRALPAPELARQLANFGQRPCLIANTVQDAVEFARRRCAENDRILVTGSFFTVAPVMECLDVTGESRHDG